MNLDPFDLASERRFAAAQRAIEKALRALTLDESELERYLLLRKPGESVRVMDSSAAELIVRGEWAAVQAQQYRAGAQEEPQVVAKDGLGFSFDMALPEAIAWAEREAGRLIVEIDAGTRAAIRALVVRALAEGGPPIAVARSIRGLIGLHSRWAVAVLNKQLAMEAAGTSPAVIQRTIARYYSQLLKARAETIARTEILRASNEGRRESYREAQRQGLLPPNPMKQWAAASDAEENCADLDGMSIPLDDSFPGGAFGDVDMPPLHPNCRCTAFLVVGAAERQMAEL